MSEILGLDLGTNSIGWGIRDVNLDGNQFIDFDEYENEILNSGVLVFKKGVGDGKSGEFSLAAERRRHRSKRRLYNAKRYRKWATLKVLSKNRMSDPPPFVGVNSLGDSAVNLAVRPYASPEDYWEVYFDIYEKGKNAIDKAGIEIPFPQRVVHQQ